MRKPMKTAENKPSADPLGRLTDGISVAPEKTGNESASLLLALQRQYKERWAILLDAIFSDQPAKRVHLQNAFLRAKLEGEGVELLHLDGLRVADAPDFESAVSSRHISSGLLTKFVTYPSSIIPVLAAPPHPGSSVLILGRPPAGGLLTLIQLLFDSAGHKSSQSRHASLGKNAQQGRAPQEQQAQSAADLYPANIPPDGLAQNLSSTPGHVKSKSKQGSHYEEYSHLSWHVYGEGSPPMGWVQAEQAEKAESLAVQIQQGLVPAKAPQGWTLGGLLTGVLQRGIRAGCCVVRTSSGDWAEACALEEQEAARRSAQAPGSPTAVNSGAATLGTGCFRPACLHSDEGEYVRLQDEQQNNEHTSQSSNWNLLVQLPDTTEVQREQVECLLDNHVPSSLRKSIRIIQPPNKSSQWQIPAAARPFDCIVLEAEASATKDAVLGACQSGDKQPWLQPDVQMNIGRQRQMCLDAFHVLRPGGHVIFCSSSLAYEETDGLIQQCMTHLKEVGRIAMEPLAGSSNAKEAISIEMKKWGAERTDFGWRMLPDLAFQDPKYFSIIQKY